MKDEFAVDLTLSLHRAFKLIGLSHVSVRKVLKFRKLHLYKMTVAQELTDSDPDKRIKIGKI